MRMNDAQYSNRISPNYQYHLAAVSPNFNGSLDSMERWNGIVERWNGGIVEWWDELN